VFRKKKKIDYKPKLLIRLNTPPDLK
jgi:hypothetical protein